MSSILHRDATLGQLEGFYRRSAELVEAVEDLLLLGVRFGQKFFEVDAGQEDEDSGSCFCRSSRPDSVVQPEEELAPCCVCLMVRTIGREVEHPSHLSACILPCPP